MDMRYIIAKKTKDTMGFGSMFGASKPNTIELAHETVFDTVGLAKEAIQTMEDELNIKADKAWSEKADNEREKMNKAFDRGSVYEEEIYMVVPVETVIQITSLPKHRREDG